MMVSAGGAANVWSPMDDEALPGSATFARIGTTCEVLVTDHRWLLEAVEMVQDQLSELDQACSRFRPDSELSELARGRHVRISPLLSELIKVALRTARRTNSLVDPTVDLDRLGYDRDLDLIRANREGTTGETLTDEPLVAPGVWRIMLDEAAGTVLIPHGVSLDLGASAKAWAADRAARSCGELFGGGVLVNLGGDLAISGRPPAGGWRIRVDDGLAAERAEPQVVVVRNGGMATSSTALRTWKVGGTLRHHIVDPRTGSPATPVWQAVTVTARTAELANAASTAAVVLGESAPDWLRRRGLAARLVTPAGHVVRTGGWPASGTSAADHGRADHGRVDHGRVDHGPGRS